MEDLVQATAEPAAEAVRSPDLAFTCPEEARFAGWAHLLLGAHDVPKEARQEFLDRFLLFRDAFRAKVVEAEREACAKIAFAVCGSVEDNVSRTGIDIGESIRARAETLIGHQSLASIGHAVALKRIDALMGAEADTQEAEELSQLADLVVAYEDKEFPI